MKFTQILILVLLLPNLGFAREEDDAIDPVEQINALPLPPDVPQIQIAPSVKRNPQLKRPHIAAKPMAPAVSQPTAVEQSIPAAVPEAAAPAPKANLNPQLKRPHVAQKPAAPSPQVAADQPAPQAIDAEKEINNLPKPPEVGEVKIDSPVQPAAREDQAEQAKPQSDSGFNLMDQLNKEGANQSFAANDFRCVYAGFFVTGGSCKPITSMAQANYGARLKNSNISIQLGGKTVSKDISKLSCASVAAPAARGKKRRVAVNQRTSLCSPMRFGLKADGSAICVQPGANATQACQNATVESKDAEASKLWAKAILKANPEAAQAYARSQSLLCEEGGYERNSKITQDRQRSDLKNTCAILAKRTTDIGLMGQEAYASRGHSTAVIQSGADESSAPAQSADAAK